MKKLSERFPTQRTTRSERERIAGVQSVVRALNRSSEKSGVIQPPEALSPPQAPVVDQSHVRELDRAIDTGDIDYDEAILLYDEGGLPDTEATPILVDPNQATLWGRWTEHSRGM